MAFDTRNVFLNLWSVYVFHTSSNHPLLRGSRRHDRSAVVFSEEIRRAERKKTSNNNIRLTVKRKRIFCCISFLLLLEFCKSFESSNLRWRLRCGAIFVTVYRCTDYCANPELSSTLARRLNWSRACTVLLSNPKLIRFGTAEARRMKWTLGTWSLEIDPFICRSNLFLWFYRFFYASLELDSVSDCDFQCLFVLFVSFEF